jgi:hypothetical protein
MEVDAGIRLLGVLSVICVWGHWNGALAPGLVT